MLSTSSSDHLFLIWVERASINLPIGVLWPDRKTEGRDLYLYYIFCALVYDTLKGGKIWSVP
jgi:predicted branched-subunit amino acid permease